MPRGIRKQVASDGTGSVNEPDTIAVENPGPLPAGQDGSGGSGGSPQKPRGRGPGRRSRSGAAPAELLPPLTELFTLLVGTLSVLIALALVLPDITLAHALAMTEDEADSVAQPAARMFSRSKLAAQWSHAIISGKDGVQLAAALSGYAIRIAPLVAARLGSTYAQSAPAVSSQAGTSSPGSAPASAVSGPAASPAANGHNRPAGPSPASALEFPPHLLAS